MKLSTIALLLSFCPSSAWSTETPQHDMKEKNARQIHVSKLEKMSLKFLLTFLQTCDKTIQEELVFFNKAKSEENTQEINRSETTIKSIQQAKLDVMKLHFDIVKIRMELNNKSDKNNALTSKL